MRFILQLLTWWNGQTLGTRLWTWRKGTRVGTDEFDNTYYESRDGKRRWVIYGNYSEASTVPAQWHGWLHHSFDNRPGNDELKRQEWELPHQENMTGSENAYAPTGSIYSPVNPQQDYQAWKPN